MIVIVICLTLYFPLRMFYNFFYLIILTIKCHMHTHTPTRISHTLAHTLTDSYFELPSEVLFGCLTDWQLPHTHTARCFQLLNTKPFVWLSNCLPLCLSFCLSASLFVCLLVWLFVCLFPGNSTTHTRVIWLSNGLIKTLLLHCENAQSVII